MRTINEALDSCHGLISPDPRRWPSVLPLVRWGNFHSFTVGHSFEHVLELGATGSGKTSACIKSVALGMLHAGYGVLFLSAKTSDPEDYYAWAKGAGRENSVVRFGPAHKLGFNLLEYEMAQGGQLTERAMNIPGILSAIGDIIARDKAERGDGKIWRQAAEQLLKHAVNVVLLATGKVEMDEVMRVVLAAPASKDEAEKATWQRDSACSRRLAEAEDRALGGGDARAAELAREYFLQLWPQFPPDTRNSVLFTFAQVADLCRSEPLHRLFFSRTDFTPEILTDGAVLVVDAPALAGGDLGKVINGLMRLAVERMTLRRKPDAQARPIAIIWDEFQTSVVKADSEFAALARSHRCALVMATQNVNAVDAVMEEDNARALFGNCRVKLFFANDDPKTNQYMADVVGKWEVEKESKTTGGKNTNKTKNPQEEYAVPPRMALLLKSGGSEFEGKVSGILIHGGRKLTKGQPWMKVKFDQDKSNWSPLKLVTGYAGAINWNRPAPDFRWLR